MTQIHSPTPAGISFVNAELTSGELTSLRIVGPNIASLGEDPCPGDTVIDLEGDRMLPGLINAHDHLQLNSLTRPAFEKSYRHVREWISDIDARRRSDPEFEAGAAVARDERLFIGGLKNLLSGVTTVAHHDPLYPFLWSVRFPTGVVRDYGWSHSLYLDGEEKVGNSYRATPSHWPWIIHAAEGLNDEARNEFERLDELGCLGPNTLLVHGVALDLAQQQRLDCAAAGLIWCPSSNLQLFGKTAEVTGLLKNRRVALGTDSRLSGGRDLFEELRLVHQLAALDEVSLESLVTRDSARLLRLSDRGELRAGARADLLILPAHTRLAAANRADVRLVLIDGSVRYGDKRYAQRVAPHSRWVEVQVDGQAKILDEQIAERLSQLRIGENGLELADLACAALTTLGVDRRRILLINPRMTTRRSARFPLSLLALAGSLERTSTCRVVDGNVDPDYLSTIRQALAADHYDAVGLTVMGGPQVRAAIDASLLIREASAATPIVWGGYFPTLYTDAAINAAYIDYAIRGPGEAAFAELLDAISSGSRDELGSISGLTWKRDGVVVHNKDRKFADSRAANPLPYDLLGDPRAYLAKTFLGKRTAAHQASVGCRFRCTFCGVAAMFRGATGLPPAMRLERDLTWLKEDLGADSIQYFDHNFFEREADMIPLLEILAKIQLPWWCYARADALLNLSAASWALVRKSKLRMAYIGAESPNDAMLKSIRKGTTSDQTLAVAKLCRLNGVIPELSFMVAPPEDTEAETERTFEFIREVKKVNPEAEIIVYIYTPLPASSLQLNSRAAASAAALTDLTGAAIRFPTSPEEWTEKQWVDYACHADAPWLTDQLRTRIQNFVTVLGCRFPTVQDMRAPSWTKSTLRALASWRYRFRRYDRPWELAVAKRLIRLADPRVTGI